MKRRAGGRLGETVGVAVGVVIVVATLVTAVCLPFASHRPVVAVGVWVGIVVAHRANRTALVLAGSTPSMVECIPCILIVQYQLDRILPLLGSSLVLFGYLALLGACIRGSWFPSARLLTIRASAVGMREMVSDTISAPLQNAAGKMVSDTIS